MSAAGGGLKLTAAGAGAAAARVRSCFGDSSLAIVNRFLRRGPTWLLRRPFSSSSAALDPQPCPPPPPPPPCPAAAPDSLQMMVCDIVASGVGSLDDMEASLHRLGPITPALVARVVDSCKAAGRGRRLLRFLSWCRQNEKENGGDESAAVVLNHAIRALAEMKDLTAMGIAISDLHKGRGSMGLETFVYVIQALVGSGEADEAVRLFRSMEERKQLPPPCPGGGGCAVTSLVHTLCIKGHARKARGVAWHHRDVLARYSDTVQRSILHGWCVHGNAREARGALAEMKMSGLRPDLAAYNDLLLCVCQRNLRFNPSALVPEATDLMTEMRSSGVVPSAISYNILLSCLGRARRVKEAYRILGSMLTGGNAGCSPDWVSYYLVIRVLYLTGRFGRGNMLVDRMSEHGKMPPPRFYHRLIGILCGVEKVEQALHMLERMKKCCYQENMGPTYDLLIAKLCRSGRFDMGKRLWNEAIDKGMALQSSSDLLDPSKTEVFKPMEAAKKFSHGDFKVSMQKQKKSSLGPKPKVKRKKSHPNH